MHVLHISTAMSWRGGEQQLAYLLEGLQIKNVRQTVFCFRGSEIEKFCQGLAIPTVSVKKRSPFHPLLQLKFSKTCHHLTIDLVHAHDAHAHTLAVLSNQFFTANQKIVLSRKVDFSIRNSIFSHFKYNHFSIKKIICVSNKIKEILSKNIQNKNLFCTIYDGIDLARLIHTASGILRKEFNIKPEELIIGNVAALAAHKDYFTFVDTAEILLQQQLNARFIIVGDGPERKKIEDYIALKKLETKIIVCGFRKDVPMILPEFDVFLFSSKTEGLGSSILDAYACGVPVVTTDAGGIPEIVIHEKTGLVSPVKNAQLLANNVNRIVQESDLKHKLTSEAKQWVKQFSKERNAELTYQVYAEIVTN